MLEEQIAAFRAFVRDARTYAHEVVSNRIDELQAMSNDNSDKQERIDRTKDIVNNLRDKLSAPS